MYAVRKQLAPLVTAYWEGNRFLGTLRKNIGSLPGQARGIRRAVRQAIMVARFSARILDVPSVVVLELAR